MVTHNSCKALLAMTLAMRMVMGKDEVVVRVHLQVDFGLIDS
jgi:hypothetical protein